MDVFKHLAQHQLIICIECKHAVLPSRVKSHLGQAHGRIKTRERGKIEEEISQWRPLLRTEGDLARLQLPKNVPEPLECLPLLVDGLRCEQCDYVCRNRANSYGQIIHG